MTRKIHSILLADDDPDDRQLFEEALAAIGSEAISESVSDGKALLAKLESATQFPDLILMDVNMPLVNGIECLQAIKSSDRYSAIKVVMYSTSDFHRKLCIELGADGYLEKPGSFSALSASIRQLIEDIEQSKDLADL